MARALYFLLFISLFVIKSIFAQNNLDSNWSVIPSFVSKIYDDCERKEYELMDCLKIKIVTLLDRVSRSDSIELDESISLVREGNRIEYARALSENDIENSISNEDGKGSKLNQMIFEKISKFLRSHALKIGLPKVEVGDFAKSIQEGN